MQNVSHGNTLCQKVPYIAKPILGLHEVDFLKEYIAIETAFFAFTGPSIFDLLSEV